MRWLVYVLIGFLLGAFVFVPRFRDLVIDLTLGDMIVRVCPGDNGIVLNGNFQLSEESRKDLTAVCTEWTKEFKDMAEKGSGTTWSEYLSTNQPLATLMAFTDIEIFLLQNDWKISGERKDEESYKAEYRKGDKKIILYRFDSDTDDSRMLFITGN